MADIYCRKGMMKKISEAPAALGTVFGLAVKGKQTLPWPFSTVIDKVLFARVKAATGGRLRFTVCGGTSHAMKGGRSLPQISAC